MTFSVDTILISKYLKDRVPFSDWELKHQRLLAVSLFPQLAITERKLKLGRIKNKKPIARTYPSKLALVKIGGKTGDEQKDRQTDGKAYDQVFEGESQRLYVAEGIKPSPISAERFRELSLGIGKWGPLETSGLTLLRHLMRNGSYIKMPSASKTLIAKVISETAHEEIWSMLMGRVSSLQRELLLCAPTWSLDGLI